MAETSSGRCLLKQAKLGRSASIKHGASAKYAALHRQGPPLTCIFNLANCLSSNCFSVQSSAAGGVNNSCYVFEAATKQNSHYLPGCTWRGGDSTRQRVHGEDNTPPKSHPPPLIKVTWQRRIKLESGRLPHCQNAKTFKR